MYRLLHHYPLINKYPLINYYPLINQNSINIIMFNNKEDIILISSIIIETISTFCLKKTLNNKLWFLPAYFGYGLSFYLFPKCLNKYSLSTAYSLWSCLGIIFTYLIDIFYCKIIIKKLDIIGLILIFYGINLIK